MLKIGNNQIANWLIKILICILLVWVLYQQIFAKEDIGRIWGVFLENLKTQPIAWLVAGVFLMPINWVFENMKWRALIRSVEEMSFLQSLAAIFAGVTFSIFTPNRIGEYGGRILFVKPENNWKAVVATLVGSYSQLLAILSFGILGFGVFMSLYFELDPIVLKSVLFLSIALAGMMLFCFYNISLVIPLAKKIPYAYKFKKIVKDVNVLRSYDRKVLSEALCYAILRYLVYSIQYYMMLRYFGIDVGVVEGLSGIATIFLFQTSIPLPPLMGLMARGELAIYIWGNFSAHEINILAATFFLWIINLIIPSLIGALFISNVNIMKSLGYSKKE
ncbi:MAG: uncharacterized membrane protein YbhN (UPF0104 family) [Saprospiraceae bacterium]